MKGRIMANLTGSARENGFSRVRELIVQSAVYPALGTRKRARADRSGISNFIIFGLIPAFVFTTIFLVSAISRLSTRLTQVTEDIVYIESRAAQKQAELSGKINHLDKKVSLIEKTPAMKEFDSLSSRVNLLESQLGLGPFRKKISSSRSMDRVEVYEVRSGDTLFQISRKYGLPVEAIKKANGINESSISQGQRLIIPVQSQPS